MLASVIAQGGAGYGRFLSGRRRSGEVDLAGNSWNAFQWPREKVVQWRGQSVRCMCVSSAPRKEVAVEVAVVVDESTTVGISLQVAFSPYQCVGFEVVVLSVWFLFPMWRCVLQNFWVVYSVLNSGDMRGGRIRIRLEG